MAMIPSSVLDSRTMMDDDSKRHGLDIAENGQLDTPVVSPCSSFGRDHTNGLHSDDRSGDDIDDNKIADFGDSELLKSLDFTACKCQAVAVSVASSGSIEATAEHCSDQASVVSARNGISGVPAVVAGNNDDDDEAKSTNFSDIEIELDLSDSVVDKHESVDSSCAAGLLDEAVAESCSDPGDIDTVNTGRLNASPVGDAKSHEDQESLHTTTTNIAPDNDCVIESVNSQVSMRLPVEPLSEKAAVDADESGCRDVAGDKIAESNGPECASANEGNETVQNAVDNDVTSECGKERSVSPSPGASVADGVSSTTSLSTVVSGSLSSSQSLSALSAQSDVSSGMPATSTTSASRLSQLLEKPPSVSVPLTTTTAYSSNTRLMSRVLQDVGLLLVSQRVFKDLSGIQKQKLGSQEVRSQSDEDMLRKLKASHENLASKNRALLAVEQRCWCGYRSESVNVLEAHHLLCNVQGRCCYCQGTFVYRTQNQMKKHLWKAHKKVGRIIERPTGSYCMCAYCPIMLSTHSAFLRHMNVCKDSFWLATNLAPKQDEKDIPVFAATKKQKHPVRVPVTLTKGQPSTTAAVSRNVSVPVLPTPVVAAAVAPYLNLQLTPVSRNPGPGTQLVQIGKQLFALLTTSVSSTPGVVVTTSTMAQGPRSSTTLQHGALPAAVRIERPSQPVNAAAGLKTVTPQYMVCPVCGAFVKDTTSLMVHMKVAHTSTHKLCQYCHSPSVSFPTVAELNRHVFQCHTTACWICRGHFQPVDRLIEHIAERHKVSMAKMLELCRCYFCSSVPGFLTFANFEEHMVKMHLKHFPDTTKLWDCILNSPDANRTWDVKQNADGTLECPHCAGHFISMTFLYRHLHLQHDGVLIKLVECSECKRRVPSTLLSDHLRTAHTRTCSVPLIRVNMLGAESMFIPPAGTRLIVKRKRRTASNVGRLKRVKTAETVIISDDDMDGDDDDNDDDDECNGCDENDGKKHTSDDDFVVYGAEVQPVTRQLRCSNRSAAGRRKSSIDDVHEVLKSIVDSNTSQPVPDRTVHFPTANRSSVNSQPGGQSCSGITDDEVEIIESIVPAICDRHQQRVSKAGPVKSTSGNKAFTNSVFHGKSGTHGKVVNATGRNDNSDLELVLNECAGGDCREPSTKPKPALAESSAQQLMARDQITMNEVEEVLEIDGETVLIVQSDSTDNADCA